MIKRTLFLLISLSLILFLSPGVLMAENPTSEQFTVYKTELLLNKTANPAVIFNNPAGITGDIIQNPEFAFGTGSAPSGTYKRIHFVVKNGFSYSGPDPCGGSNPVSGQGLINPQADQNAQVDLYFATADDGGGSGWYNNGTSQYPFLMQSPIVIESGKTTTVKLLFNTANTLQCMNDSPVLFPPSMNVTNVVQETGACTMTGSWWFVHYNISVWPRVCDDPSCSTYHFPSGPQEIFDNTEIVAGWGTVTFNADNTWTVEAGSTFEDQTTPGMAEHRHKLLYYDSLDPEEGYHNPAGSGTLTGTYSRSGNRIIMYFPEGGYIEGAISSDCKTFTGVNVTGEQENDIVFAVKKGTGLSTPSPGKYVMSQLGFNLCYDVTGSNCYSTGDTKIKYLSYRNEIAVLDTALGTGGTALHWTSEPEYHPQYDGSGNLTSIRISHPGEELGISPGFLSGLTFRDDGLMISAIDDPAFFAFGENWNGVFAAVATNANEGDDRINAGFMIKLASAQAIADLNGTWQVSIIESQVDPGADNTWLTDDDHAWYGLTYGEVRIQSGVVTYRSFIHKNVFDGTIEYEAGSGETIQLKTECYKPGAHTTTTACSDPNAPRIPVFYIYGTGSEAGRIIGKMALDSSKKAITLWAPVDLDETPPTGACNPPRDGYYCDDTGGGTKALFGVGVKIE